MNMASTASRLAGAAVAAPAAFRAIAALKPTVARASG